MRGVPLDWFGSYLRSWTQSVRLTQVDDKGFLPHYTSPAMATSMGVPQGSFLRTTLFIIFINNPNLCVSCAEVCLSADHTSLWVSIPSLGSLKTLNFLDHLICSTAHQCNISFNNIRAPIFYFYLKKTTILQCNHFL